MNSARPTLAEIAPARPRRGAGALSCCASQKSAILALLRERGQRGVLGSELYSHPELYGRSPRNRISELRRDGCLLEGGPHGSSDWFYRLIRECENPVERPAEKEATPTSSETASESEYMRRVREEQARAMPLFAGVRQ
jgi:hypothetical protein